MRRPDDVEIMRDALRGKLFEQGSVKVVRYEVEYTMSPVEDDDAVGVTAYLEPPQGRTWDVGDVSALSIWVRRLGYQVGIDRYVSFVIAPHIESAA